MNIDRNLLAYACLEQVMRHTDSVAELEPLVAALAGRLPPVAALGRLTAKTGLPTPPGSPMLALVAGSRLDGSWRQLCPVAPGSLWAQYEALVDLLGRPSARSPLEGYAELLERADVGLCGP